MKSLPRLITRLCLFCLVSMLHAQTATEVWVKRYNGPANGTDYATALAVDNTGNVIVTGWSVVSANDGYDYYTAKYAGANGALLWEKRYNSAPFGGDGSVSIGVDTVGNVIVTGESDTNGYTDFYTAKYSAADGALIWEKRYDSPAHGNDVPADMVVDAAGDVIVTGYIYNPFGITNADYYTAKYATANGALLWERRYNGPADGNDKAFSVAVDATGNVAVTGYSTAATGRSDYYTARYAAADGALLWEKRYNWTGTADDIANSVAIDGEGNVIVTGESVGSGSNFDYYTAKYAVADGALLWEKRYNGPANDLDKACRVAVDPAGNVIVTGSSISTALQRDYYTAKYAAANGALLWEKRLPTSSNDSFSMAVDALGSVVVTGESYEPAGNNRDYYTAKYAAADGALLWEARYNGPANGDDFTHYGFRHGRTLVLTADGGAVVTGASSNGSNPDYATVRYTPPMDGDGDGLQDWWEQVWWGSTAGHAALDDFDHDSIPELMEEAFGLNPKQSDTLPLAVNEDDYLTITITKHPGVTYEVQTAGTPYAPDFTSATTTVLVDDATTLKVRDKISHRRLAHPLPASESHRCALSGRRE